MADSLNQKSNDKPAAACERKQYRHFFDEHSGQEQWRCAFCYARKDWIRSAFYRYNRAEAPIKTPEPMSREKIRRHLVACVRNKPSFRLIPARMVYEKAQPFLKECADLFNQFFVVFENGKNGGAIRGMYDESARLQIWEYNASFKTVFAMASAELLSILPLRHLIEAYAEFHANWPSGGVFIPPYEPPAVPNQPPPWAAVVLRMSAKKAAKWVAENAAKWEAEQIAKWGPVNFHEVLIFLMHPGHGILDNWEEFNLFLAKGKLNRRPPPPPPPVLKEVALAQSDLSLHVALAEAEVEWSIETLARDGIQTRASSEKRKASELSDEKTDPKVLKKQLKTGSKSKSSAECASASAAAAACGSVSASASAAAAHSIEK